jgi:hypothetical protein
VLPQTTTAKPSQRLLHVNRNEREFPIKETTAPIQDRDGVTLGAVLVLPHDVSAARESARKLEHQATHDALTGLTNRREYQRPVGEALQEARISNNIHAMYFMDLDQFAESTGRAPGSIRSRETPGHGLPDHLCDQLRQRRADRRTQVHAGIVVPHFQAEKYKLRRQSAELACQPQGLRYPKAMTGEQ